MISQHKKKAYSSKNERKSSKVTHGEARGKETEGVRKKHQKPKEEDLRSDAEGPEITGGELETSSDAEKPEVEESDSETLPNEQEE